MLYSIHGLLIQSEIPLDAHLVSPQEPTDEPDYRIVNGEPTETPFEAPPGRLLSELRIDDFASWVTEDEDDPGRRTVRYAGLCDARLDRSRRSIVVHPQTGADEATIPILVGGGVLAHALVADGYLVLHASAVETGGRAVAVMGTSGAGKSTLAAILCAAGARLIADDVLRCETSAGRPICFPGNLAVRLRPGAASLAEQMDGAAIRTTADDRTAAIPAEAASEPVELAAVVVPRPSRGATELTAERLSARDGLVELLRYPRLVGWQAPDSIRGLFVSTAPLAEAVPVLRATVPWGPPFPPDLARELIEVAGVD